MVSDYSFLNNNGEISSAESAINNISHKLYSQGNNATVNI
jgi:hypothetical protein